MSQTQIIIRGRDQATPVLQSVARSLQTVANEAQTVGSRVGSTLATIGKIGLGAAAIGVGAIGVAFGKVATTGFSFNNSMEQVRAQLNAFTKDGQKSAEILDMIRERAAKTPFAFEDMARATAGLIPAATMAQIPLEKLVETAEILAASNPAEGLEGAAFALREAVSGDFTSLIERFNLPRQYINQLKEEGIPNIEIVRRAMLAMGYDAELVANMANTLQGRWSTLMDTLQGFAALITEPMFEGISAGLGTLNQTLDENKPKIESVARAIGETLGQALNWLITVGIPTAVGWIQNTLIPALMNLREPLGIARDAVLTFAQAWTGNWVNSDQIHPLHQAAGELALTLRNDLLPTVYELGGVLTGLFETMGLITPKVRDANAELFNQNTALQGMINGSRDLNPLLIDMAANYSDTGNAAGILNKHFEDGYGWIQELKPAFAQLRDVIMSLASVQTTLGSIERSWREYVQDRIQASEPIIRAAVIAITKVILTMVSDAQQGLASLNLAWEQFKTRVAGVIAGVIVAIESFERRMAGLAASIINAFNTIISWLASIGGRIAGLIATIWPSAVALGRSIVDGIIAGLQQVSPANVIASIVQNMIGAAKNMLRSRSPSEVFRELGHDVGLGFILGLNDKQRDMIRAGVDLVSAIARAVKEGLDALDQLANFKINERIPAIVDRFVDELIVVLRGVERIAGAFKAKAVQSASEFSDAATRMLQLITNGVTAINAFQDMTFEGFTPERIDRVRDGLIALTRMVMDVAREFSITGVTNAAIITEQIERMLGLIGNGVSAIRDFNDLRLRPVRDESLPVFRDNLIKLIDVIQDVANRYDVEGTARASTISESLRDMLGIIDDGVDAMQTLVEDRLATIEGTTLYTFKENLIAVIRAIADLSVMFDQQGMDVARTFAERVAAMVGLLADAVDVFDALSTSNAMTIPDTVIRSFVNMLFAVVNFMTTAFQGFEEQALATTAEFAEQVGVILEPLTRAVSLFEDIKNVESIPPERMQTLAANIYLAYWWMNEIAKGADEQGLPAVQRFSTAIGTVFNALKTATDVMKDLLKIETIPPERFGSFRDNFFNAVNMMAEIGRASEGMLADARRWRDNAVELANLITEGINAIKNIPPMPDIPSLPSLPNAPASSNTGSMGTGTFTIIPFGGGRALGGPVRRGIMYQVGEQGPEWFIPDRDGIIVPNREMMAMNAIRIDAINVSIQTTSPVSSTRLASQIAQAVRDTLADVNQRTDERIRTRGIR